MSKEEGKKPTKQAKPKEEKKQQGSIFDLSSDLINKAKKDLVKSAYATPSKVASNYNIAISTARRLLKQLEKEGVLILYSPSRRNPVYVPKQD